MLCRSDNGSLEDENGFLVQWLAQKWLSSRRAPSSNIVRKRGTVRPTGRKGEGVDKITGTQKPQSELV